MKNLIAGAGFAGATLANLLANKGEEVLIIDKKDHIAGNSYDYRDKNGIMIHKYGSHIFHTNNQKVWEFVNQFSSFNTYMHEVVGIIDGIEAHIPFNFNTLYQVFPRTMAERIEEKQPLNSMPVQSNLVQNGNIDITQAWQGILQNIPCKIGRNKAVLSSNLQIRAAFLYKSNRKNKIV